METDNLHHWISNNERNISRSWYDSTFLSKVILQLNKDFSSYYPDLFEQDLDGEKVTKTSLVETVMNALIQLEKEQPSALPQLLYSIDIPENIFQQVLNNSASFHKGLAEVIVIREAYKVWIRVNFS